MEGFSMVFDFIIADGLSVIKDGWHGTCHPFVIDSCVRAVFCDPYFLYTGIGVMKMPASIRLKTGFFRTSAYRLAQGPAELRLVPADSREPEIRLPAGEILSITVSETDGTKRPQVEILTSNRAYEGVFCSEADCREAIRLFRNELHMKIQYHGSRLP